VMFNHMADAHEAALDALAATLDEQPAPGAAVPSTVGWCGSYIEPESRLAVRISLAAGKVCLRYGPLELQPDGSARAAGVQLRPVSDGLWMDRLHENHSSLLHACDSVPALDVTGRFYCDELDAELTVADAGGALYGAFSGFLGQSRMELMAPVGSDVWMLPCPRALDHTPPGDWTVAFQRNATGEVCGVTVGCWLARRLQYRSTH